MSGRARVGVAAAGAMVLALVAAGCGGGGDEAAGTPKVEVSGAPDGATNAHAGHSMLKARQGFSVPEITEQGTRGEILEAFWDFYRVQVETQHKMDPVLAEYSTVMVGKALTRHSQLIEQYNDKGLHLHGAPRISDVSILEVRSSVKPPQAVVGACVDDTNWVATKKPRASKASTSGVDYTRVGISMEQGTWRVYDTAEENRDQTRCSG
jgi:hypothetical protein